MSKTTVNNDEGLLSAKVSVDEALVIAANRLRKMAQEYADSADVIVARAGTEDITADEAERMVRMAENIRFMGYCLGVAALAIEHDEGRA